MKDLCNIQINYDLFTFFAINNLGISEEDCVGATDVALVKYARAYDELYMENGWVIDYIRDYLISTYAVKSDVELRCLLNEFPDTLPEHLNATSACVNLKMCTAVYLIYKQEHRIQNLKNVYATSKVSRQYDLAMGIHSRIKDGSPLEVAVHFAGKDVLGVRGLCISDIDYKTNMTAQQNLSSACDAKLITTSIK